MTDATTLAILASTFHAQTSGVPLDKDSLVAHVVGNFFPWSTDSEPSQEAISKVEKALTALIEANILVKNPQDDYILRPSLLGTFSDFLEDPESPTKRKELEKLLSSVA